MNNLHQGQPMKRAISSVLLVSMMSLSVPAFAADNIDNNLIGTRPTVWAMGIDAGLVRPVGLAATVIGIGLFVVTLPFSALGGNIKESAATLVGAPAKMTFTRCLGCTEEQDTENRNAIETQQANSKYADEQ